MSVERFEEGADDPTQNANAGPPKDTGSPGDAGRSGDTGRTGEPAQSPDAGPPEERVPDKPPRESPKKTNDEERRAESRTRSEYADDIAPPGTPPIPGDAPKARADEEDRPQNGRFEAQPVEAEQLGKSSEGPRRTDQLPAANDSGGSDEGPPGPDRPADVAESDEHNHRTTDDETVERSADSDELDGPVEEDLQSAEESNRSILDRLLKAHAADLATDHANTTDPDNKQWTAERNRIHGEIVRELYNDASAVPCEYKAIIAGGLPGAGKTTILTEQAGIDLSKYLTINPDEIKGVLATRGLIPEIDGLSPMEASDLAHEESSVIAKHLAHHAQAEGKNIIWDITMSRLGSTQERIDSLRASGYEQIDAIFVDIPIEASIRRTQDRHREGQEDWQSGRGMGGRFIPPEVIRNQADSEWGCKNKRTFEDIKPSINNWTVFDNGVDYRRAEIIDSSDFSKISKSLQEKRPE